MLAAIVSTLGRAWRHWGASWCPIAVGRWVWLSTRGHGTDDGGWCHKLRGGRKIGHEKGHRGTVVPWWPVFRGKAGDEIRTHDIHVGNVTLYH